MRRDRYERNAAVAVDRGRSFTARLLPHSSHLEARAMADSTAGLKGIAEIVCTLDRNCLEGLLPAIGNRYSRQVAANW